MKPDETTITTEQAEAWLKEGADRVHEALKAIDSGEDMYDELRDAFSSYFDFSYNDLLFPDGYYHDVRGAIDFANHDELVEIVRDYIKAISDLN